MSDTAGPGHNSDKGISERRLKSFIERIEHLEEERKSLAADVREVYAEAKSGGFDVKVMRKVVALRKMDAADRAEMESLIEVYMNALGDLKETPLGDAALQRLRNTPAARKMRKDIAAGTVGVEFSNVGGKRVLIDKDGTHELT